MIALLRVALFIIAVLCAVAVLGNRSTAPLKPKEGPMDASTTGWPTKLDDLRASLLRSQLSSDDTAQITARALPAWMLATTPTDEEAIPIGATKIGGRPDLPPNLPWPERGAYANADALIREAYANAERFHADAGLVPPWMDKEEGKALLAESERVRAETREFLRSLSVDENDLELAFSMTLTPEQAAEVAHEATARAAAVATTFPLAFLAQFDLAALPMESETKRLLPDHGRLYIFYDLFIQPPSYEPEAGIALRVIYDPSPVDTLKRAALPEQLVSISDLPGTTLAPAAVTLQPVMTTVPEYSAAAETLPLSDDARTRYGRWLSEVPGWPGDGSGQIHQFGGWRRAIQATMEGVAQLAANGISAGTSEAFTSAEAQRLLQDEAAWRLLFQLGPDEAIGNPLPGALNIILREEDLKAGRFDRAWAVYEQS